MITGEANQASSDAEAAIARVLQAEAAAKADEARCEDEAKAVIAQAESAAQSISASTEQRMARIRERMRRRASLEVQALESTWQNAPATATSEGEVVDRAAALLAAELAGSRT